MAEKLFTYSVTSGDYYFYARGRLFFVALQDLGQELDFETTWECQGAYLFVKRVPDEQEFKHISRLLSLLSTKVRFLWFTNMPQNDVWEYSVLMVEEEKTVRAASFHVGGYEWTVFGGVSVQIQNDSENQGFVLISPDESEFCSCRFKKALGSGSKLFICANEGSEGDFQLKLSFQSNDNLFEKMGAGLQYIATLSDEVETVFERVEKNLCGYLFRERFVIFKNVHHLDLQGSISMLEPLNQKRSFLLFQADSSQYETDFSDIYGETMMLVQANAKCSLVFQAVSSHRESSLEQKPVYYLTYQGDFLLQWQKEKMQSKLLFCDLMTENVEKRFLCGLAGTEYLGLQEETKVCFSPNHQACLSDQTAKAQAVTAWISFSPPSGNTIAYFSQPLQNKLYAEGMENALSYAELPFSVFDGEIGPLPMAFYQTVDEFPKLLQKSKELEEQFIRKKRFEILTQDKKSNRMKSLALAGDQDIFFEKEPDLEKGEKTCVTPYGLLVGLDNENYAWNYIGLAKEDGFEQPNIRFTDVKVGLKNLLLQSSLFLAVTWSKEWEAVCSHPYCLNKEDLDEIGTLGNYQSLLEKIKSLQDQSFETKADFESALLKVCPELNTSEELKELLFSYGSVCYIQAEGWAFDFAADNWRTQKGSETVFLMKYGNDASIADYLDQDSVWSSSLNPFAGNAKDTVRTALLKAYNEKNEVKAGYENFVEQMHNPFFHGILVLNCPIRKSGGAEELEFLMSELNKDQFYAHHIGICQNNVKMDDGKPVMYSSKYFGLVDYEEANEICNTQSEVPDFEFSVTKVFLRLEDSRIVDYDAVCELAVHRLFSAGAQKKDSQSGSSLIFDGSCVRSGDSLSYGFSLRENADFYLKSGALTSVCVKSASMSVHKDGSAAFSLSGAFGFYYNEACDLFSYGGEENGLEFSDLLIEMNKDKQISLVSNQISFLTGNSAARKNSLADRFCISLDSFLSCKDEGQSPDDLDYMAIECPVLQSKLTGPWYGLCWKIALGDQGSLGNGAKLDMKFLTAWDAKEGESPDLYIGIQLPGQGFKLQGILEIGFHLMELYVADKEEGREYQFCLRDFAVRILGLTFPPGNNALYIFGEKGKKVGWYGAYLESS